MVRFNLQLIAFVLEDSHWWKITEIDRTEKALAATAIVTEKETVITAAYSRQNRPQEKWTPWSSLQLLCCGREEWGWRTGHILEEAGEASLFHGRASVKKARWMNDLLIGSLLHFLALFKHSFYFVVSRWCVDILITAENPALFGLTSFSLTLSCTFFL